jgi:hypothetical protein
MAEAKGVSTPTSHEKRDNHKDDSGYFPFREAVGTLTDLAAPMRPNNALAVNKAARIMTDYLKRMGTKLKAFSATCDQQDLIFLRNKRF